MAELALEMCGVSKRFGALEVLKSVHLEAHPGEVIGFLGPNGAGKTTSVRVLNGLLIPDSGESRVLGLDPAEQADAVRSKTGVVTENAGLYERLSGRQNLAFFADIYGIPFEGRDKKVSEMLDTFGLGARASHRVETYSTGMKKRLAIARALIHDPEVLFLDEPTSGLDPEAARDVLGLISELSLQRGRTILMATHNLVDAERLCSRVAVIYEGRTLDFGTVKELKSRHIRAAKARLDLDKDLDVTSLAQLNAALPLGWKVTGDKSTITVEVQRSSDIPEVAAWVVGRGLRLIGMEVQGQSLEDVYFALVSEVGADKEA